MRSEVDWQAMIVDVARMAGVAERLLAEHVDDGRGYCTGCKLPQSPDQRWPCTLRNLGLSAQRYRLGHQPLRSV